MNEMAFNHRFVIRKLLWSYMSFLSSLMMDREKEEDIDLDAHFIVHEQPVTVEDARIFSEQQINVVLNFISQQ